VGLERQHHAGEDRRQTDDRQREIANIDHLSQHHAEMKRRCKGGRQRQPGEHDQSSGRGEKADENRANRSEKRQHRSGTPRYTR
jgi:hypothetical protein